MVVASAVRRFRCGGKFFGRRNRAAVIRAQIQSVISRILGNQIQFLHAIRDERLGFGDNIGLLPAAMRAAHARDDAEAARMIAAFGDFHVSEMTRREAEARRAEIGNESGALGDFQQGRVACCVFREDGFRVSELFGAAEGFRFFVLVRSVAFASNSFNFPTTFVFRLWTLDFGLWTFSARRANACFTMSETCATWSMPMNASTSGSSFGSSSRKRCGRQPETISPWPRLFASRTSADSRMVSTLSSCAESMNEHVLTITTSACAASLVISTPLFQQRAEHDFGVHQIFGAAEGNQADTHRAFTAVRLLLVR